VPADTGVPTQWAHRRIMALLKMEAIDNAFAALPSIFRECVGPVFREWDLSWPFAVNGHIYATDACIAVRAATGIHKVMRLPDSVRIHPYPKSIDTNFLGPFRRKSSRLPSLHTFIACEWCKGRRERYWSECSLCDGKPGESRRCSECKGLGDVWSFTLQRCRHCEGCGFDDPHQRVKIGEAEFALQYVERIIRHKGLIYLAAENPATSHCRFVLRDGTEGVLMPLRPKGEAL